MDKIADMEKAIEGLEAIMALARYEIESVDAQIVRNAVGNAIALLKAQEAVEPVVDIDTWKCGNCGHTLEHQELLGNNVLFHEQYNYCPECGRAVKWG